MVGGDLLVLVWVSLGPLVDEVLVQTALASLSEGFLAAVDVALEGFDALVCKLMLD